jgi:hypothetical protein
VRDLHRVNRVTAYRAFDAAIDERNQQSEHCGYGEEQADRHIERGVETVLDVVQVRARGENPVPGFVAQHVAELRHGLRRLHARAGKHVIDEARALRSRCDLHERDVVMPAVGVCHFGKIGAFGFRLHGVHDHPRVPIEHEEVAVAAIADAAQSLERLFARIVFAQLAVVRERGVLLHDGEADLRTVDEIDLALSKARLVREIGSGH